MKSTKLFVSSHHQQSHLKNAIEEIIKKRDDFFASNKELIQEIDKEEYKFVVTGNGLSVYAILEFVYYVKDAK